MAEQPNLEGVLRSLETIEVAVNKNYNQADIKQFKIYENGKFLKKLHVISKGESKSTFIYTININHQFKIGAEYMMSDDHNEFFNLDISLLALLPTFEESFRYDGKLGAIYSKTETTFRVFAPLASECYTKILRINGESYLIQMIRLVSGVYEVSIPGNLNGAKYLYVAKINGRFIEAVDPYAFSVNSNSRFGFVIDPERIRKINLNNDKLEPLISPTQAIIYEADVRDMTSLTNVPNKGSYLALSDPQLTENGEAVGLNYLKSLGVTHIQLLPVYDFATINDDDPFESYNWGYDPLNYFAPEGSYASKPDDPYSRIEELRGLVSSFHNEGLKVIMDVVFNHTFNRLSSSFEKLCPRYYYRFNADGNPSNGSYCGNEVASENYMVRKFIIDNLVHFVEWYGMDGFRFDLMGLIDKTTMNDAFNILSKLKPDILLYGEGWDMPSTLPSYDKATINNAAGTSSIGFFNDRFRDIVKGKTNISELSSKGYLLGDINYIDGFKHSYIGSCVALAFPPLFNSPCQSINYVECHDNNTLFDKISVSNKDEEIKDKLKRVSLINAVTVLAFGVPFIHAGQEIGATKFGHHNSYNEGDLINGFNYTIVKERASMLRYFKDLLKLKKSRRCFNLDSKQEILDSVKFENLDEGGLCIVYKEESNKKLYVFINPTQIVIHFQLPQYGKIIFNEAGLINSDFFSQLVTINPLTLVVVEE